MTAEHKVNVLWSTTSRQLLAYEVILRDLGENLIKAASARKPWNVCSRTMSPSFSSMSACRSRTALNWRR